MLVLYDLDGIESECKLDNITKSYQLVDCCNKHLVFLKIKNKTFIRVNSIKVTNKTINTISIFKN